MELLLQKVELVKVATFRYANCYRVKSQPSILVVKATAGYIAKTQFQEIFINVGKIVAEQGIKKLIFDKSELAVFHQPSMEWYFTVWKEQMFHHGLKTHRKILPKDKAFRENVRLTYEKIRREFPEARFNDMDIRYSNSLEEAVED